MLWVLFAILCALFDAFHNLFRKIGVSHVDEYVLTWSFRALSVLFLAPVFLLVPVPEIGGMFLPALLVHGSLSSITAILHTKALKHSDLSITMPMVAFTPIFVMIASPFIVSEFPGWFGVLGIILVVIGSYVLNIKRAGSGLSKPFRELFRERGPQLMLIATFMWGLTSVIDKIGVINSSPIFWALSIASISSAILFPVMLHMSRSEVRTIKTKFTKLLPIGLFGALTLVMQFTAIELTLVANVIAIKRLNIIFSVMLGYLILREGGIKQRLLGAVIMIAGAILVTLFG